MDIVVSFEKYIPKPNIFFGYFEIMKTMKFIRDVKIERNGTGDPVIKVVRHEPKSPNVLVS